jgi:hypothetical protein
VITGIVDAATTLDAFLSEKPAPDGEVDARFPTNRCENLQR